MGAARERVLGVIEAADHLGRFRMYRPVTAAGKPIYVHAKVLIVDDRLLRVGSSNVNNRSMGFDTECDLAVEAVGGSGREAAVAGAIRAFRAGLLAEHLGASVPSVEHGCGSASLIRTIEDLRRTGGRTLLPITGHGSRDGSRLAAGELLDPEAAEPILQAVGHAALARVARTMRRLGRAD